MKTEELIKFFKEYGGYHYRRGDGIDDFIITITSILDCKPGIKKHDFILKLLEAKEINNRKWDELIKDAEKNL